MNQTYATVLAARSDEYEASRKAGQVVGAIVSVILLLLVYRAIAKKKI